MTGPGKIFSGVGLKTKIIAVTTFAIILTTIIGSGFFYYRTKSIIFDNLQKRGVTICENLSYSVKYGVLTEDTIILNELVEGVMKVEDVAYVTILDEKGNTLVEKKVVVLPEMKSLKQQAFRAGETTVSSTTDSRGNLLYDFSSPIIAEQVTLAELGGLDLGPEETVPRQVGAVQVGLSLSNVLNRLKNILRIIIVLTLIIIAFGVIFSLGFVRIIIGPIAEMAKAAARVASGDLSQKVEVDSTDEIGQFADQFNAMTTALKKRDEQLKDLARFPSEDPFPVLRITRAGIILYANQAGKPILNLWACHVGESAPPNWRSLITDALDSSTIKITETECQDRILSFAVAPVPEAGYVNIYGLDVTERKKAEQEILKLNRELEQRVIDRTAKLTQANKQLIKEIEERKRLEREILNVSERERRRIGRELHDSIGQHFAGIAFMTKVLERKLTDKLPEEAPTAAEISKLVSQATEEARGLAKGLHPLDLNAGSLVASLHELASTTERLFEVKCTFKCAKPMEMEDTATAVHLYRIAQEAITNAVRHGRAKNIEIRMDYGPEKSVLTIKNDGLDFPVESVRDKGMGLKIMDHRVQIIEGSLDIKKADEGGTVVTCSFPTPSR